MIKTLYEHSLPTYMSVFATVFYSAKYRQTSVLVELAAVTVDTMIAHWTAGVQFAELP